MKDQIAKINSKVKRLSLST